MSSPFPGMDPYLERPDVFPDLHGSLIILLKEQLQGMLPERYYAASSQRTWIDASERYVEADVDVVQHRDREQGSGVAPVVDEQGAMPVVIEVPEEERTENYLQIYTGRSSEQRLVTSIEILSPSNKARGNRGRELYLQKQREMLDSQTHLVEFDLLRAGLHTTAVPEDYLHRKLQRFDYHCCVHQFDRPTEYFIYPVLIEQELPPVSIPLLPEDGEVTVGVQALFERAYNAGPYRKLIDYDSDPPPPAFDADRLAWIRERANAMR